MPLPGGSIVVPSPVQDASTSSVTVFCTNAGVSSSEITRVSIILQGYGTSKSLDVVLGKRRKPRIVINYDLRASVLLAACGFREKDWVVESPILPKTRRKFLSNMMPEEVSRASIVDVTFTLGSTATEPEVYAALCSFGIIDAVITCCSKSRPFFPHVFVKFVNFHSAFEVIDHFKHVSWMISSCTKELFLLFEKVMGERALDVALDNSEKSTPSPKKPNPIPMTVTDTKSLEQIQKRRNAKPETVVPISALGDRRQKMREHTRDIQAAMERQPSATIFMTRGIAPWRNQAVSPLSPETAPQNDGTGLSECAGALANIGTTPPPITNVPSVSTGSSVEDSGSEIDDLERAPIRALGSLYEIGYPYTGVEMASYYDFPLWSPPKMRVLAPTRISRSPPPNPFLSVTKPALSPSMRDTPEQPGHTMSLPTPHTALHPSSPRPQLTQDYETNTHEPGESDDRIHQLGKRRRDVESEEDGDEHKSATGTLITESQRGTSNVEKVAALVTDVQRAALLARQFAKRRRLAHEEEDGMAD